MDLRERKGDFAVTVLAETDIDLISTKMSASNPSAAMKWWNGLFPLFQKLIDFPNAGRAKPELGDEIRAISYRKKHVVYYTTLESKIMILRIFHVAQDVKASDFFF